MPATASLDTGDAMSGCGFMKTPAGRREMARILTNASRSDASMQDVHARAERGQAHIAWRGDASLAVYSGAMPLSSWLFIRDSESIWVERPYGSALIVAGPGAHREEREFIDEAALQAFQIALAEKLAAQGWFLWDHNRDRRTGSDRRATPRPTADRRQPTGVRT